MQCPQNRSHTTEEEKEALRFNVHQEEGVSVRVSRYSLFLFFFQSFSIYSPMPISIEISGGNEQDDNLSYFTASFPAAACTSRVAGKVVVFFFYFLLYLLSWKNGAQ